MDNLVQRDYNEHLRINSEKSNVMDDKYKLSDDPWGNGARDLYTIPMSRVVSLVKNHISYQDSKNNITWLDIGCGGGFVGRAIRKALVENNMNICMEGYDISDTAINRLYDNPSHNPYDILSVVDMEEVTDGSCYKHATIVSLVEVLYYLGTKRPWKKSVDMLWDSLPIGAIVVVADGLIPYQYRDYLKTKADASLLHSYTDPDTVVSEETTSAGKKWKRNLKVRIYQKG